MPDSAVAANVHQAFNILLNVPAQIPLDPGLFLNHRGNGRNLLFRQVLGAFIGIDLGFF
jgi:hypothetical protein